MKTKQKTTSRIMFAGDQDTLIVKKNVLTLIEKVDKYEIYIKKKKKKIIFLTMDFMHFSKCSAIKHSKLFVSVDGAYIELIKIQRDYIKVNL